MITSNWTTAKCDFHQIWIVIEKHWWKWSKACHHHHQIHHSQYMIHSIIYWHLYLYYCYHIFDVVVIIISICFIAILLIFVKIIVIVITLQWRHNEQDSVSNHQPHNCLLSCLFRPGSNKTSKLRVTGLCAGNSPETGELPAQMPSNAENVSIWWRHHVID